MQTNKTRADSVKSRPAATNKPQPTTIPARPASVSRFGANVGQIVLLALALGAAQEGRP